MKSGIIKSLMIFIIFLIIPISNTYAKTDEQTLESQQDEFKIQDFITNANKYSGDFFEGENLNNILNEAIKGNVDNSSLLKRVWNLIR